MKKQLLVCGTLILMLSSACGGGNPVATNSANNTNELSSSHVTSAADTVSPSERVETPPTPEITSHPNDTVENTENNLNNAAVSPSADISPTNTPSETETGIDYSLIPTNTSEPFIGRMSLDSDTENFFYGTWKVEKLLGFANSWNDGSEYPTGQKVIGDEIIIHKDFFSSKGLKNYTVYQYEIRKPTYDITTISYNSVSFYRLWKTHLPNVDINDEIRSIEVSAPIILTIPVVFLEINYDRLILSLEATNFELTRIAD